MTVFEYVNLLYNSFFTKPQENLLHYGHVCGWLQDQDETFPETLLDKRTAARITHMFMKLELNIEDSLHVQEATKLSDLYTCRVCAEHVAQMYVQGIMPADEDFTESLLFNHLKLLQPADANLIISKIKLL